MDIKNKDGAVIMTVPGDTLTGANLTDADLAWADLTGANLTDADLTGADLTGADLTEVDLIDADLTGVDLIDADLTGANLYGAKLPEAPVVERLHTKMLSAIEAGGLDMKTWHTCETTHCRAGWAIVLAGDAGWALEKKIGPSAAGALIINASCPYLDGKVPDFVATNEDALADIRRCAELEAAL